MQSFGLNFTSVLSSVPGDSPGPIDLLHDPSRILGNGKFRAASLGLRWGFPQPAAWLFVHGPLAHESIGPHDTTVLGRLT